MFLETIRSPGLAHRSYLIGDGHLAAVVDPRIDIDVYLELAHERGARIVLVFETHRNEDLVSGAFALAERTGARVLHGTELDFGYGEGVAHGHEERLGDVRLCVLHTPGHTDESISVAFYDEQFPDGAVGVFSGDALFVGDVGRTDFHPERAEQDAGALYDSIHRHLLPLGDQALLYPAHGAGSVCGEGMADRDISSIGHERRNNPLLQLTRDEFVARKTAEHHVKPPYFRRMEVLNRKGVADHGRRAPVPALDVEEFTASVERGAQLVDVRGFECYAGCSIPGSLALPLSMVSGYAGWLLDPERSIALVGNDEGQIEEVARRLVRMGFRQFAGHLAGGQPAWNTSGRELQSIPAVSATEVQQRIERGAEFTLLDVRKRSEWERGHLPGAHHCFLGELPQCEELHDLRRPITTFCGSGRRALVAASLLRRMGIHTVENCFGSLEACKAIGCELQQETA